MSSTIQQSCVYNTQIYEDLLNDLDALPFFNDSAEDEEGEWVGEVSPSAFRDSPGRLEGAVDDDVNINECDLSDRYKSVNERTRLSGVSFGRQVPPLNEPWRFWQLVVGALCCVTVSSQYAANLYSGRVQEKYNLTQGQMTTISTCSDVAGLLMLPFSMLYDYYGAQPIFLAALIIFPMHGVFFGLTLLDVIDGTMPLFILYFCMLSVGGSLLDLGSVMTLLSIFPANRGAVVAVMKTFSGMGSALFGAIHLAFFPAQDDNDTSLFLYFLAIFGIIASFLGVLFVDVPPYMIKGCEKKILTEVEKRERHRMRRQYLRQKAPKTRFAIGFTVVVILAIFLPIQGVASAYINLQHRQHVVFALIAVGLFLPYLVMALPLKVLDRKSSLLNVSRHVGGTSNRVSRASYFSLVSSPSRDSLAAAREIDYIAPQYQTSVLQSLRTFRFWALLWTLFSVTGAQIVVIGNMRFLYGALAGQALEESFMALLVVINGVGSGIGRVLLSFLEMRTQGRPAEERTAITFTLFIPTALALAALLLLLLLPSKALWLPCFIMALANGSTAAAVVIVLRTIYAKDIAKHYNCSGIASIAASLLINRVVYGEWYTREAEKGGGTLCYGMHCVFVPLMVCFVLNLSALFSTTFIHCDYKKYYSCMLEVRREGLRGARHCAASSKNGNLVRSESAVATGS